MTSQTCHGPYVVSMWLVVGKWDGRVDSERVNFFGVRDWVVAFERIYFCGVRASCHVLVCYGLLWEK